MAKKIGHVTRPPKSLVYVTKSGDVMARPIGRKKR